MITFLLTLAFAIGIVSALIAALLLLGNLLPSAAIASAILAANGYLAVIYGFLPLTMTALLAALAALFTIEVLVIAPYKLAKWVWKKIPGVS